MWGKSFLFSQLVGFLNWRSIFRLEYLKFESCWKKLYCGKKVIRSNIYIGVTKFKHAKKNYIEGKKYFLWKSSNLQFLILWFFFLCVWIVKLWTKGNLLDILKINTSQQGSFSIVTKVWFEIKINKKTMFFVIFDMW